MSGVFLSPTSVAKRGRAVAIGATIERHAVAIGAAVAVAGLASANGGFFPVSWGWSTLAFCWAAGVALLLRSAVPLQRIEVGFLAALACLAAWVWISIAWTSDVTQSVFEGERSLVLLTGIGAALVLAGRRSTRPLLGGVLVGLTVVGGYALATRLFPGRVGVSQPLAAYRLFRPIGYWNGLGIAMAIGVPLALGFALRARRLLSSALAGASLLMLLPTLYFTYSRGSWIALGAGIAAALILDRRRVELATGTLALIPAPALAIWFASRSHALTRPGSTLAQARHDGHRIAAALILLAVLEVVVAVTFTLARRRLTPSRRLRIAWASVLVAVLLAVVAAAFARYGSPPTIARRAYHAFQAEPSRTTGNLNARLFSLSGSGRADLWRVAWRQARAHPLLGGGAGSYERYWLRHRPNTSHVQDAHNLYLETLAETGAIGLALLVLALATPLAGAIRARRHPLVPLACGAYVAYLVHAAVDWDWELAGVTLAAALCGVACLIAGRGEPAAHEIGSRARAGGIALAIALSAVAFVALVGNTALEAGNAAATAGHWGSAERHARTAVRWMPWSSAGWETLGEAQLAQHRHAAGLRSLHRALAKDPGNWVLWLDLVGATRGAEQVAALAQAFRLNPRSPELVPFFAAVARP
jgi:O-Antigen ligase